MSERLFRWIAVAAIAILLPAAAHAQSFIGPTGSPLDYNWSTAANWSTGAVPIAGNTTYINNGQTAVLDVVGATRYLYVGDTASSGTFGGLTINNDLTLSSRLRVGEGGLATSTVTQTAGNLLISVGQFYIGGQSKTDPTVDCPKGVYNLQGGAVTVGSSCNIGHRGIGEVYQTGGQFTRTGSTGAITIGSYDYSLNAYGLYDISGGMLTSEYKIAVGTGQAGTLRVSGTGLVEAVLLETGRTTAAGSGNTYTATVNQEGGAINVGSLVRNDFSTCVYNLSGGTLRLTSSAASTTGTLHLLPGLTGLGGVIEYDPALATAPTLTSNATYDAQAGTVNVPLGGTGIGLTKTGLGTVTLGAANLYTGATSIEEGVLKLLGSVAGDVAVHGGALEGTGTVAGALASLQGGTVAPGTSVGTLTVAGNATLAGALDVEYDSSADTIDMLAVSGQLDLSGGTLSFADLAATPVALTQPAYVFATYGTLVGAAPTVQNVPDGYTVDYAYQGKQVALVAVPEPSTLLLMVLAGLTLAVRRRR